MTTPLPMSLAVRFLFKSPCMNGPADGPTSRAVGVTNQPIRIAAPAQKPPATIWMTRSVVITMSFYHNVDPRGVSGLDLVDHLLDLTSAKIAGEVHP